MKSLSTIAAVTLGICLISPSVARALPDDGWWFLDFTDVHGQALNPIVVGIDSGSGFEFMTLTDDDADGTIRLPRVPVGGGLAIGGTDTGNEVGCDLWDLLGTDVVRGTMVGKPLLIVAEEVEGESLGVDYGEFTEPPYALTPGAQYTVVDGRVAAWPEVRFVNDFGVPGLEEFVQTVDSLPNFTGDVIVADFLLSGTFVPEPSSLLVLALCGSCSVLLFRRRPEFASSTAVKASV